ncbi:hypothetical protein [Lactobacillus pasteurii]|uniref:Uncharacterized protein n=1 Tax=Lactobacillus pasteurii DSM 23907 = CRBIP 24.76 TaxID=1423790 RepID=I7IZM6_9LACO|nr:hypothetical protein [Lactobacillus pasteurii]TDG76031.1 hypothetical protein C5L33_001589 [Lactobacillus pasteurii]CCI85202.1 Putative uncharacterized protein [Lactobacillus pasteurii DSM 23907 = CRBIP 24.76]
MKNLNENKQIFEKYDQNHQLLYRWSMDLINHRTQAVWVMNHLFINPDFQAQTALDIAFDKVLELAKSTQTKVWPLDPRVISDFKTRPNSKEIWYQSPASE